MIVLSRLRGSRLRGGLVAGLIALALTTAWTGNAVAVEDGEKFQDWVVKCGKAPPEGNAGKRRCALVQAVEKKTGETKQRVMTLILGKSGAEERIGLLVSVPLGVYLPAGITLTIDGAKVTDRIEFQLCSRSGCRALVHLDAKTLNRFKAGRTAMVKIKDARRRPLDLPISLKGVSRGLAALGFN